MPGFYDRTSAHVIHASRAGVPAIASIGSPQSGPDGTAALQSLANLSAPGGPLAGQPLDIVNDQQTLCGNLQLYSGTTLRGLGGASQSPSLVVPSSGLWMRRIANGTDTCCVGNANWASNFGHSFNPSNITDQDITIRDLFIDGQSRNNSSGNGSFANRNSNGVYLSMIRGLGVARIRVENVSIYDPPGYHTQFANIDGGHFKNMRFCDPTWYGGTFTGGLHTDGLHLNGPWDDIIIDGLFGTTGDDFLALNAADGNLGTTGDAAVFGGFSQVYFGHGTRLSATNLRPVNCYNVVRLLTGNDVVNSTASNVIDHVMISNVAGSVVYGSMVAIPFATAGSGGTQRRVTLRDWNMDLLTPITGTPWGVQIGGNWEDLTVDNHHYRDLQANIKSHQINSISGTTATRVFINNYWVKEDSSEVSNPLSPIAFPAGTIDEVVIANSGWNRNAATSLPFAVNSGATINRLSIQGVSGNNIQNLLSLTGGTTGQVDSAHICHRNPASSGQAINVGAGVTLPLLTACGSDTAALVGTPGGTITTKQTDGTERAT